MVSIFGRIKNNPGYLLGIFLLVFLFIPNENVIAASTNFLYASEYSCKEIGAWEELSKTCFLTGDFDGDLVILS